MAECGNCVKKFRESCITDFKIPVPEQVVDNPTKACRDLFLEVRTAWDSYVAEMAEIALNHDSIPGIKGGCSRAFSIKLKKKAATL